MQFRGKTHLFNRHSICIIWSLLLSILVAGAEPLFQDDFENGLQNWTVDASTPEVATISTDAACMGTKGLHLKDLPDCLSYNLYSPSFEATPGKQYLLSAWGRNNGSRYGIAVKLLFTDQDNKSLKPVKVPRSWDGSAIRGSTTFRNIKLQAIAPEGCTQVKVKLTSYSKDGGDAYLDDLQFREVDGEMPKMDIAAVKAELKQYPATGQPVKVVLKLDDIKAHHGKLHSKWRKTMDYLIERKIKAGYGIITNSLDDDLPAYFEELKKYQQTGFCEFWYHGHTHGETKVDGKRRTEFSGPSVEEQAALFTKANQLATEKLGFTLTAFGAPFNQTDANTIQAFAQDPHMKVWLFAPGKADLADGQRGLLRVVELESPTFVPNFESVVQTFVHNRNTEYLVMQGHPTHWGNDRWDEFVQIIDFLTEQGCEFVLPTDMAPAAATTAQTP